MPKNRIHKRKDGRFTYKVSNSLGDRIQIVSRTNETKDSFRKRCDKLDDSVSVKSANITFNELFDLWNKNHLSTLSVGHKENMENVYRIHLKKKIGHYKLIDITPNFVFNLLQSKINDGYSKEYITKMRNVISGCFSYAIKSGIYSENPLATIILSYGEKNKRENPNVALSDDEIKKFFEVSKNTKYCNYFRLMLLSGLRPSECLGLQINDLKDNVVRIQRGITMKDFSDGKTKFAIRNIPATDEIKEIFQNAEKSKWLFPSISGQPSMNAIVNSFNRIKSKLDFQITLYSFRHTFATRMAKAKMNPKTLQYIMGHSKIEITLQYYVGIDDDDLSLASQLISSNLNVF